MSDLLMLAIWFTLMWLCARVYYLTVTICMIAKIDKAEWKRLAISMGYRDAPK